MPLIKPTANPSPGTPAAALRPSGFTLIELLVAMTTLVLLVTFLAGLSNQTGRVWQASRSDTERRQNGRVIIETIVRDLQMALMPIARDATDNLQLVKNPSTISAPYTDAIFWQAPLAHDPFESDIAEVGYFIRWLSPVNGVPRPVLCRFYVQPTLANGSGNPDFRIFSHPNDWVNDDLLDQIAPADAANDYAGLFAENVIGLWVRCYDVNDNDLGDFDSRTAAPVGQLPAYITVEIVMLDDASVRRMTTAQQSALESLAQGAGSNAKAFLDEVQSNDAFDTISAGARAFSTTIALF